MATTTTSLVPTLKAFPYIGIGVAAAQYITAIPSAEVVASLNGAAITVAAAGEDQVVNVTVNLSRTFAWVLVEANMRIQGNDVDNWDQACRTNWADATTNPVVAVPLTFINEQLGHNTAAQFARTYRVVDPSNKIMVSLSDEDAILTTSIFNTVIDGAAATMKFYARFLRFDRNQAQYWAVNTPMLTR